MAFQQVFLNAKTSIIAAFAVSCLGSQAHAIQCAVINGTTFCTDNGTTVATWPGGSAACSGGICADSTGRVIPDPYHPPAPPRPPEPDYYGGHHGHGGYYGGPSYGHRDHRYPQPRYPQPSYPQPSTPDPDPYPTPSYPDASTSEPAPAVFAKICVGTFSGKFASGQRAKVVTTRYGEIQLVSKGRVYPASGSCTVVAKNKAALSFTLDDDSAYVFRGSIVKAGAARTVVLKEIKNGKVIDSLSLQ